MIIMIVLRIVMVIRIISIPICQEQARSTNNKPKPIKTNNQNK